VFSSLEYAKRSKVLVLARGLSVSHEYMTGSLLSKHLIV